MSKQTLKGRRKVKKQPKLQNHAQKSVNLARLPGSLMTSPDRSSIQAQAAHLTDTRFPVAQRQAIANQIRDVSGNHHLQRVMAQLKEADAKETLGPIHSRFAGNRTLERMYKNGGFILSSAHNGNTVSRVQQALADLGYALPKHGVDGKFGSELKEAIHRFQEDSGLEPDRKCGKFTIRELSKRAPSAGAITKRYFDYQRLLQDGKLEISVAFGYDEHMVIPDEIKQFRDWLSDKAFLPVKGDNPASEYFKKKHKFKIKTDKGIIHHEADVIIQLIVPGTGAKAAYAESLANTEVVAYAGHARYGMGPDFDPSESADEQFVIGGQSKGHRTGKYKGAYNPKMHKVVKGRPNDLEALSKAGKFDERKYQVWVFTACSTENYLDELRGGLVKGKDRKNLDIIGTGEATLLRSYAEVTISFLDGLLDQTHVQQIVKDMATHEGEKYFHEGLGDNKTSPH